MARGKSSRRKPKFTHVKRQRQPPVENTSPVASAAHEEAMMDMPEPPAPGEEESAVVGTLMQIAPRLWVNDYKAEFAKEAEFLESKWQLVTAAKELKSSAPESSYSARGLLRDEESRAHDEFMRELRMASAALRQANQQWHTFSVCARSVSCLLRRLPSKDWRSGLKDRSLLSKPTTIALLNEMMRVRPPPEFATSSAIQCFVLLRDTQNHEILADIARCQAEYGQLQDGALAGIYVATFTNAVFT